MLEEDPEPLGKEAPGPPDVILPASERIRTYFFIPPFSSVPLSLSDPGLLALFWMMI